MQSTKLDTPGMGGPSLSRCQSIGGSVGIVWVGGWGVRFKDQTEVLVGINT